MKRLILASITTVVFVGTLYGLNSVSLFRQCAPETVAVINTSRHTLGTGIMLDDIHVLTVAHMIETSTDAVKVKSYPGVFMSYAKPLVFDRKIDLMILTLDHDIYGALPCQRANQNAVIGQAVLVIGDGAGLMWTATTGIISGTNRLKEHFWQTDAVINPGNSGGPVFNSRGKLVGIVDAKISDPFDGIEGIGLFIPIETVNKFIANYTIDK